MPSISQHGAYEYAERIRARLPRRLQELREAAGLSRYALERKCGISREMIGRVERGDANPSLCLVAQLSHGIGLSLRQFVTEIEDGP